MEGTGERTLSTVHFLFIIQETEKGQEHDLYLNQILDHFELNFFPRSNNKNFTQRGPAPISLRSENSSPN